MKLLGRILLGAVALIFVLAIALAVAVSVLVDPEKYRPLLERSVAQATGRQLALEGELGLDLFPCCSVTLGRATLGNPPGFPEGAFASVEGAALSVKIWPLLTRREVEIGTVRLDGLDARLHVRADGAANWEFDTPADAAAPAGTAPGTGDTELHIERIELRHARLAYRDETDGSDYLAEDLELDTGRIRLGEPFDLTLDTRLTDQADGTTGTLALRAKATLDPSLERLELSAPNFDIQASGGAVPARELGLNLTAATLGIEFADDTRFRFGGLEGKFTLQEMTDVAGDASGTFSAAEARLVSGASTELALPALEAGITITGKDIPGGKITTALKLKGLALDVDKVRGSIEGMQADVAGLGARLALTGGGRLAETGASLAGTLELEPVSPRALLGVLREPEPRTADPKVLTRLAGSARWALGDDTLQLSEIAAQLDDTKLTGTLGIADFDKPATRLDLKLDAIDLDRYLEPETDQAAGGGKGAGKDAAASAEDIPVETLRDLRLAGRLRAGQLRYAGVDLADVDAQLVAADGRVRLDPLAARVYGGQYRGTIAIDATAAQARLTLDQQLTALQVGQALQALFQNDRLSGALTGRITASGTGNTSDALLRTLAGNVAVSLADGVYLGTDLWHEIRSARARIRGDTPPAAPASPRTPITALELGGAIRDGVLVSERMFADIPFIRVSGAGRLDLVGKAMDYRVQAKVVEKPVFEDGTSLGDLAGLTIPITLTGALDKPKVGVDLKGLAAGVATQKLRDRLLKKLGGDEPAPVPGEAAPAPAPGEAAPGTEPAGPQPAQPAPEEKPRDALKRSLRDLLKPRS